MPGVTEQGGAQRAEGGSDSDGSTGATSSDASGTSGVAENTATESSATATSGEQPSGASAASGSGEGSSGEGSSSSGSAGGSSSGSASGAEGETETDGGGTTATKTRTAQDPPPDEAPTTQQRTPEVSSGSDASGDPAPRGRAERAPLDVGELVWKVATVLASVIRIVAYVIAVVLVAYVALTIVGVNPLNAVAQVVGGVANSTVLAFRDLFLIADPTFSVVVNYGLAAVFWALVAEFGSRIVRWLGARFS